MRLKIRPKWIPPWCIRLFQPSLKPSVKPLGCICRLSAAEAKWRNNQHVMYRVLCLGQTPNRCSTCNCYQVLVRSRTYVLAQKYREPPPHLSHITRGACSSLHRRPEATSGDELSPESQAIGLPYSISVSTTPSYMIVPVKPSDLHRQHRGPQKICVCSRSSKVYYTRSSSQAAW